MKQRRHITLLGLLILGLTGLSACKKEISPEGESPIARAYNSYLYQSDIRKFFGKALQRPDSALLVNAYIRDWAKEQVIQRQAYDNIDADEEVLKLVQDYRASLIRAKYEEALLRKHLDTTITQETLASYHEKFKEDFPLSEAAVKYYLVKLPKDHPEYNNARKLMRLENSADLDQLVAICARNNFSFAFEDQWFYYQQLAAKLPANALTKSAVLQGIDKVLSFKDQNFRYLVRINEALDKGEPIPLDLIGNNLTKVILKEKKIETLETVTEHIYKNELNKNK
ncbi:MAG: hypothetical protein AAF598_18075, partial [Bacteroidota bacterium]